MATLYGKTYSRQELLRYVGDVSQIARVKPYRLIEGQETGLLALDVTTGSGFAFTVLPDRGMDISTARYKGHSLAWRSSTSDTHPAYFDHEGENGRGWLRGFYGGLVVTCGLTYAGASGEDKGLHYGIHGRISNLPATNVSWDGAWQGDEYVLSITGKVRETTVFGENLVLTRTIQATLGTSTLTIHDEVENCGFQTADHMMLYHINIGFPVVNDNARLISPTRSVTPRDADAVNEQERYAHFQSPTPDFREKVYFHELASRSDGSVTTAIVNPELPIGNGERGLGVYCTFAPEQLPRFIEWKMMGEGTYVVGMEPANCLVAGRAAERAAGTLQHIAPGEIRSYDLDLGVLEGSDAIETLEAQCQQLTAPPASENTAS